MSVESILNENLTQIKKEVYDKCSLSISRVFNEPEGKEYDACQFELNGKKIISRTAKITPKKIGQFVTCWKRNTDGITEPFNIKDAIDFYIINVKSGNNLGQFVFPKSELVKRGIISTPTKDGKRGFRVYPIWDEPQSKQAQKTQKWQLKFFYTINSITDFERVIRLYNGQ